MTAIKVFDSSGARAHLALIDVAETLDRVATLEVDRDSRPTVFRWVWVVLVGSSP